MRRSVLHSALSAVSAVTAALVAVTSLAVPSAGAAEAASWTVAAPLPSGRSGAFATRLPDGSVLLAGGYDFSGGSQTFLASALRWSPSANAWTATGPMTAPASSGHSAVLSNGSVLVAGGTDASGFVVPQVYDPAAGSWTATLAPPTSAITWLAALPAGKAIAGVGGTGTVVYDPALNGWASGPDLLADHGAGAMAVRLADERVLVFGGTSGASEVYDPADGAWDAVATWPRPRTGSSVVLLDDGRVAVVGGSTDAQHLDLYSPAADAWAAGPNAKYAHTASDSAAPLRGTALFAQSGGRFGAVYDAVANAWRDAGVGSVSRAHVPAVALADGRVLLPGGGLNPVSALVELYVPAPIAAPALDAPAPGTVSGDVPLQATNDQAATMRFFAGGVLVATRPATGGVATGTFSTFGIANGAYDLTAQACNVAGCGPLSAPVTVTVDNAAPAVTTPAPAAVVEGRATFAASAPGGGVRFLVDGANPVFDGTAPYTADVNTFALSQGTHAVTATSCRADGSVCNGPVSAPVEFVVDHMPAITSPAPAAVVAGTVDVTVAAKGTTVSVLVDGTALPAAPAPVDGVATVAWPTFGLANGTHILTARNCDPDTGCLSASDPVTVTVANSAPAVTSPANGAGLAVPTQLEATSTGGTVRFEVDGTPLGEPVSAPYRRTFDPGQVSAGTHTIVARQCSVDGSVCEGPASAPVQVTTEGMPTITQPVDGASVSGLVPLKASTYAPSVRFAVDGSPLGNPAPSSGGVASATWNTFGLVNGPYTVTAQGCDGTTCVGETRQASVTLVNVAPALTGPANGAVVGDAVTLTANAPAGSGVDFRVDGISVGFDGTAPYSVKFLTNGWGIGALPVTAVGCSADGTRCDGPISASRTINLSTLKPRIAAVSPSAISPNRDGVRDATTITYDIETTSTAVLRIRNAAGQQVWGKSLGTLAAGRRTQVWNGANSAGIVLGDGVYEIALETSKPLNGGTIRGVSKARITLDRTGPAVFSVKGSGTFYPVVDGYADHFAPSATVSERVNVVWYVVNSAGAVVAKRTTSASAGGVRISASWNGRLTSGALAPAGTYRYKFTATDVAGNTRSTSLYSFGLSHKKLVAKNASVVLTPAQTKTSVFGGYCSAVFLSDVWPGGYEYRSEYYCYDPYDPTADIAGSDHQYTLPSAVKYANVRLGTTGEEGLPGFGDVAKTWYRDTANDLVSNSVILGSSYGTRWLPNAPVSLLAGGRTLRWTTATVGGMYYDVRNFTVAYTYYVLQ